MTNVKQHLLHLVDLTGVRGIFDCSHCRGECEHFVYQCRECEYYLCVSCSHKSCKLTFSMMHPKHEHKLKIFKELDSELIHGCDLCQKSNLKIVYRCHECDYDVCFDCILSL